MESIDHRAPRAPNKITEKILTAMGIGAKEIEFSNQDAPHLVVFRIYQ